MLSADDLIFIATSEDDLQHSIYNLKTIKPKYNIIMSTEKTKILAFQRKEPIPSEVCIDKRILEELINSPMLDVHCHIKKP
jgi:hypothetical protein